MRISYDRLIDYAEGKGVTINQLRIKGIITKYTYEAIINNEPIRLDKLAEICCYLGISIEDAIEIECGD